MASSQIICFRIITFMSLMAANIITIEQHEPNITEYYCEPNEPCTIRCLSSSACAQSTLHCPARHDCDITCDPSIENGSSACLGSIIHAENSKHLSITVTPHVSNAQSMTIYAPYPHPTHTDHTQSTLTCHSSDSTLHQCIDLQIYTTYGFDDIQLLCNDATSSCDLSGSVKCGYSRYKDGNGYYHEIDECTHLQFEDDNGNYQCSNHSFCTNNPQTTDTTLLPLSTDSLISESSRVSRVLPTTHPTTMPILVTGIQMVDQEDDSGDIHALILVVAGTATVCCVGLMICAGCMLIYIRFNRDYVEDMLLRRYLSGKGSLIPYKDPKMGEVPSTEASNDEGTTSSGTLVDSNDLEVESEDSTDLGLTALNQDVETLDHESICQGLIYEDELDKITNDINININIRNVNNINTNAKQKDDREEETKANPELHILDREIRSNLSIQNSSSNHPSINPEISSQDSRIGESQETMSPRSDYSPRPAYEADKLSLHETGLTLPSNLSYDAADSYQNGDDLMELDSLGSIDIEKIPLPPPAISIAPIGPDLTDKQMEQRAQTHLQNIRNRSRCFGYIQPEILYEVDETFSSTEEEEKDRDEEDDKKNGTVVLHEKNATVVIHVEEQETDDEDGDKSGDDCSESDDLLEDGVINIVRNERVVIKIDTSDVVSNSPVPDIPSPPVPPLPSIVSTVPSIPLIRHISHHACSIPRVSLPSSLPSCAERNDPEILSDDGQLPSLPMNEIGVFH